MASLRASLLSQRAIAACSSRQLLQLERQFSVLRVSPAHKAASKAAASQVLTQNRHSSTTQNDGPPTEGSLPPAVVDALIEQRMEEQGLRKSLFEDEDEGFSQPPSLFEDSIGGSEGNSSDGAPNVELLQGFARAMPLSPSYFTRQPSFNDNYIRVTQIFRKYGNLAAVPANQLSRATWRTLSDYKNSTGEDLRAAQYKDCLRMAKRLYLIHPKLKPQGLMEALEPFIREVHNVMRNTKTASVDQHGRALGVGRRKTSTARAWVVEGTGEMIVNGKTLVGAFGRVHDRESAIWALKATDRTDKYNVWALVEGGGTTGQAEALTLAIAKALVTHEPALKTSLRKAGCISRDPRMVERKKHGRVKARKRPTWVKR